MATESHKDYEDIRHIMKREKKNPNVYTQNRNQAMLERTAMKFGDKAVKEIAKEFKLYREAK